MRCGSLRVARTIGFALVFLVAVAGTSSAGKEKARVQVEDKVSAAMESYDLLEYEAAKKLLKRALVVAKRNRLGRDPVAANVHLHLGIVLFSGIEDKASAEIEFISAIEIDSGIKLPKVYRTKEMQALMDKARKGAVGGATDMGSKEASCGGFKGISHELVETAKSGSITQIDARVSRKLKASKVSLFYRPRGTDSFVEVVMSRQGSCHYSAAIPVRATRSSIIHYYIEAQRKGRVVGSRGDDGSPNIIEVEEASFVPDNENPLGASDDEVPTSGSSAVSKKVSLNADDEPGIFVTFAAGSGLGYVTGQTEATKVDVACCLAPALLHLYPEIGYYVSRQLAVSAALRAGFPVGANVPGHATFAPAGLVRVRYAVDSSGEGLNVSGSVGIGVIRHTVRITDAAVGMDTDTTATGPVLMGAGLGFGRTLSGALRLVAEANMLVGMPLGISEFSGVEPKFGAQLDLNLGLQFAF